MGSDDVNSFIVSSTFSLLRFRAGSSPAVFVRDYFFMTAAELAGLLCCRVPRSPHSLPRCPFSTLRTILVQIISKKNF